MVLAAMAPGSDFPPLRGEGLPKAREPLELLLGLVCLDTLAFAPLRFEAHAL